MEPLTDADGYLVDVHQWTPALADTLAASIGLELTAEHWRVIEVARQFYADYQLPPVMRPLIKALSKSQPNLATSLRLMALFPGSGSPAKRIALVSGLPRPTNCL